MSELGLTLLVVLTVLMFAVPVTINYCRYICQSTNFSIVHMQFTKSGIVSQRHFRIIITRSLSHNERNKIRHFQMMTINFLD